MSFVLNCICECVESKQHDNFIYYEEESQENGVEGGGGAVVKGLRAKITQATIEKKINSLQLKKKYLIANLGLAISFDISSG